jgi:hypothetical protein
MSNSLKRYQNTIPKAFNPEQNRVILALFYAIALADDDVEDSISEAKKDLWVRTATGKPLDKLANSLGVERPATLGLSDPEFQELIPNLSLKPKNIRKAFYDTADVFWGELFSRANITTSNVAPFNVSTGDVITVQIDLRDIQYVKVLAGDIQTNGAATAEEIQTILSKIKGATVSVIEDALSGDKSVNIRTNTPGPTGKIQIFDSTMIGSSKLDFEIGKFDILNLDQRVAIYNIRPNELLIEIPAIVPALRRTLKGSHHFHTDSTLASPVGVNQGTWQGSFLFNPSGSENTFTITRQKAELQQSISKGNVYTSVAVDDTSLFENPSGELIFGFGTSQQEGPVKYRGIANSTTILLDPSYTFRNDHNSGTLLNVISKREPYTPVKNGTDLAIYLTSPSGAREVVQSILEKLAAAGIILNFVILSPKYKYLIDNPYISSDDAPSS